MLPLLLLAHDLYLMPERFVVKPGETIRIAVHNGDSFPESDGPPSLPRLRGAGPNVRLDGKRAVYDAKAVGSVLHVRTIPNFLSLESKKFANYLRSEGLTQIPSGDKPSRELYSKYAKTILRTGLADFAQTAGLAIEFIPQSDPSTGKFRVVVMLHGRPEGNLAVSLMGAGYDKRIGRTAPDGSISVTVPKPGVWKLHTVAMKPAHDKSQADWESFWASLTFEVQ
ncbi:MAG: DUF4198 domain-containing protein [Bryobacteraceae bacterium]|nr:DUF4198 domain-containing protein [Bryobacteraceae bacterium]